MTRVVIDSDGYTSMLRHAKRWPGRIWAVEGCNGIGRHVAERLLADGEQVVDVPPKMSARVRVFSTGQGRETDATDAHSIALVGTRMAGLRLVVDDQQLSVLRVLADRRRSLGEDHTRIIARLHHLLLELLPDGAKKDLSAAQAKAQLATVRPRDAAGKARRRVAAELTADFERVYAQEGRGQGVARAQRGGRHLAADVERRRTVWAEGLLIDVGDITRIPSKGHVASWEHRTARCILRRPGPPSTFPRRQPADQQDPAHHGDCAAA